MHAAQALLDGQKFPAMQSPRQIALLAAVLLAVPESRARAEALFASPPHFLTLRDREQIVFFINEPVVGALASRTAADTVDVVVPRAIVDPTLRGTTFRGDESGTGAGTRVALAPGPHGNAAIRITTGDAPGGVHAYSEDDPPRLIVDLLAAAAQPTPARTATPAAKRLAARATAASVARSPRPSRSPAPTAALPTPRPTTSGRGPSPLPTAEGHLGTLRSTLALAAAAAPDATAAAVFPCAWQRVAGVAFCAPDPDAYAAHHELASLASALAKNADAAALPPAPASDEPAALYLAADRELVIRAASGRLLPAIDLYRRALRRAPAFVDAPRARLNVALAYRTLGFDAELQSVARAAGTDPTRAVLDALVGDLAREHGATDRAREAYARAAGDGGAGACLAARGRAALLLASEPPGDASADVTRLPSLCPATLLADPETIRVQARQELAGGDPRRARAMLEGLRRAPGAGQEGIVLEDVATAAVAVGEPATARAAYTQLASGRFGARLATRGTLGLARLDAAGGDVDAGFRRLGALAPEAGSEERRRFAHDALARALVRGAAAEAVAIVVEQGLAPSALTPEEQILLARSYRAVGLTVEAEALLRRLGETLGKTAPDALWEERGDAALASAAVPQALAVADDWLRTRGTTAPAAALALRARALAALGQSTAAAQSVSEAAAQLDPVAARALRLDVAAQVRVADPAFAARLVRAALADDRAPALAAREAAAALRTLAEAAEASGEDAAALAAYGELTSRYPDQPSAAGATYRMARLRAGDGGRAAVAAYADVARSRDALERRVGTAAQDYEMIVRPFENRREEP
jgi:tetratricopeptide (TPR) repeat protein